MKQQIILTIQQALKSLDLPIDQVALEHPQDMKHGDYACNIAMKLAKVVGRNPRELADEIAETINMNKPEWLESVTLAGPGFINIKLTAQSISSAVAAIDSEYGRNESLKGKKAIVEYTDPNPFKVLHIGHLMSNTIGESISRIIEWSGAETKRACYQGDVGMHVAKSIYGLINLGIENIPKDTSLTEQVKYLGQAYAHGSTAYKDSGDDIVSRIKDINKQVYQKTNQEINNLYNWGRQVSLDYFETQYKQLGTFHNVKDEKAFDFYFFESEVGVNGLELVKEYLGKGIFEESDGAVVFKGEEYGLHTRVFINSEGLPTYEAKELGLAKVKYDTYPYDLSIVLTGNEINEYFKVLLKVMSFIYPDLQEKTVHIGHGMLKLPTGKMSSRTGNIVSAEDLINQVIEKASERENQTADEATIKQISISAIKYAVLRQTAGKDIIFDFEKSLSFEGDSGPYLQYTHVRCKSILRKATEAGVSLSRVMPDGWEVTDLERMLTRFPELVERSLKDYSSHHIASYLIELAHHYNSWYSSTKIIDTDDPASGYKVMIAQAVAQTIKNGLWLLGIESPEKM